MKVEFEKFENPMPANWDTMDFLKKKGNMFFIIYREGHEEYDHKKWKNKTVYEDSIETLEICPNDIIILGHDFFNERKNAFILGYCQIEFPKEYSEVIRL